ncbi:FYVE, RhoGEF and PH domain-containing protein 6-like isoform X2 [Myxocyprinus asiaticus]|uniref:FYVE, RhoGEF and PH domain-containing protein 6-like isoform X2 n=1 Tax=Myxocyprinus asiaticus TaxID=70543 RepID=UPI002222B9DB|nr:FYVE, RhoGEF and PH domain-containing protein 6-like isoform X2 [Myxocyprinus asiaticus]
MMKRAAGEPKPPLAPKPKVLPTPAQTELPLASKLCVHQCAPPTVKSNIKPALPPKPCLSKIPPPSFRTKPPGSKVEHQAHFQHKSDITRNVSFLNVRNGTHTGNNKPEWDYVIPICVCNDRNCADCSPEKNNQKVLQQKKSTDAWKESKTEGSKMSPPKPHLRTSEDQKFVVNKPALSRSISGKDSSNNNLIEKPQIWNTEHLKANQSIILYGKFRFKTQNTRMHQKNIVSSINSLIDSRPSPEPIESMQISSKSAQCSLSPDKVHAVSKPPEKVPPVVMQQKANINLQESSGLTKRDLTVLPVDINSPDLLQKEGPHKENITTVRPSSEIKGNQRGGNSTQYNSKGTPVPAPRQKIHRLQHNKTQHVCQHAPGTENKKQNLDGCPNAFENSLTSNQHPTTKRTSQKRRPDNFRKDSIGTTEHTVDGLLIKTRTFRVQFSEMKNEDHKTVINLSQPSKKLEEEAQKLGLKLKPKSKSLSSADMHRPDGLKKTSFLRIMDLDISVKKVPQKLFVKSGQALDCAAVTNEQTVDTECYSDRNQNEVCSERQISLHNSYPDGLNVKPVVNGIKTEIEQNVDDLEVDLQNSGQYEHIYEDILEYENLPQCSIPNAQDTNNCQSQSCMYEGDGIYEIPDVFPENSTDTNEQQDFLKRNVFEEMHVDDTHSEGDDSSLEEEEDNTVSNERQMKAKKTKVAHIVKEIMTSEKIFVKVLKLLHIDFREAVLKASCLAGKAVIDERVLNQILCSLPQLYELNYDLLKELEERVACWNENCGVADIFVKKGPYLKMYSTYIREFEKNVALLEEHCRKNPAFAKVVREFESNPCCANLAVTHYMLKPIQRIPQYQLLLTAYLNHLDEDSPDYRDAEAALAIVKEVANHANEIVKQEDNSQKLYDVQCRLMGHHVIVQPGRVLLKEGILMKLSRKVLQPRMFFLFNDSLLYGTPVSSGNFRPNNMLSLAEMKVSKPSQEGYQNELNIESVERSFILSASSSTYRDEWLQAISTAIEDYTKKETTFTSIKNPEMATKDVPNSGAQLGTTAPIWIPDPRATMCMICTCEFTLTWRRHHCRACGKVVCQACSTNKHPLKYLKNQLARVCDLCLPILQQNSDQSPSSTLLSPTGKSPAFPFRKQKRIPAALKEVSANTDGSSMSGYLERTKGNRKQWKRFWFVIMNKVLYTYGASEDVAALESQPLLGFSVKTEMPESSLHFKLYHKNTLYYIFKANDPQICERWIEAFEEATVL